MLILTSTDTHNSDSVWPLITGLILSPVVSLYKFQSPFLSLAVNIGLLVGALLWGLGTDIWGRRLSFNLTLLIAGVFGLAAGGANNFVSLASLLAVVGVGVGGNMPVANVKLSSDTCRSGECRSLWYYEQVMSTNSSQKQSTSTPPRQ